MSRLQRSQIVRHLAKAVGVPVKELLDATSPPEEKADNDREVNITDDTAPWDGPVDGITLFKDIYNLLGQAMWMADTARMTVAFWIIASVSFRVFRRFPYLRIKSPDRNCGKSTLIDLVAELVFKPLVSADVSPAALYRLAEAAQPTILLDEFDNADQIKDLTQLLNAGYDANRVAIRCNADKGTVERFRTFCPKVTASIRHLAETAESRSLPIDMQRVPADAERNLTELCDIDPAVFLTIKRKILAWVEDNIDRIKTTRPERPDWLKTRDWDIWRPLFTVADVIGGPAPALVLQAAGGVSKDRVIEQSLAIEILSCIREMSKEPAFVVMVERGGKDEVFLPSQKIVDFCNAQEEASWANWRTGDKSGLTVERLAKELCRQFKLQSVQVQYQSQLYQAQRHRGYWLASFKPLFASYLPPEHQPPPPEDPPPTPPSDTSQASGGSADGQEKENSRSGVKNTSGPVHFHVSGSNAGISDGQVAEMDLCAAQVQNEHFVSATTTQQKSYEEVHRFRPDFRGADANSFLAIDVETAAELESGGKVSRDALNPYKAELRILSAATPSGNIIVHDFRTGPLPDYLRTAIATNPLIAHGTAFDLAVLAANGIKTSRNVFCTLTASRLLTAGLQDSNDLGAVMNRHLDIDLPKQLGAIDWGGMFLTDQQLAYCRNDVAHLHRLKDALEAKLANPVNAQGDGADGVDLVKVADLEMSLIPLVVDIRLRGVRVDRSRLELLLAAYEGHKKQLATDIRDELQAPNINLASPEQLLHALKSAGLDIPNTRKETLSAVAHPIAALIVNYRGLVGLCDTMQGWLEYLDGNNRLYPPLNPLGADTGRFSCKKPNLLATPRDSEIRGCFIPDDDYVLIEADYANIEMRIAAWFAMDERMLVIFRDGGDIHGETAALILGDRQARQQAKPINFGCLYGGGAERLRITARTKYGIEFSPEQARQYHAGIFNMFRGLQSWQQSARASAPGLTYGTTLYGRRRWADPADSKDTWNWNRFQLATNLPVQGTGADAIKLALVRLHRELAGTDVRILLQVHDSILVQAPRESAHEVQDLVRQAMCGAFHEILGPDFPVALDTSISERWG